MSSCVWGLWADSRRALADSEDLSPPLLKYSINDVLAGVINKHESSGGGEQRFCCKAIVIRGMSLCRSYSWPSPQSSPSQILIHPVTCEDLAEAEFHATMRSVSFSGINLPDSLSPNRSV